MDIGVDEIGREERRGDRGGELAIGKHFWSDFYVKWDTCIVHVTIILHSFVSISLGIFYFVRAIKRFPCDSCIESLSLDSSRSIATAFCVLWCIVSSRHDERRAILMADRVDTFRRASSACRVERVWHISVHSDLFWLTPSAYRVPWCNESDNYMNLYIGIRYKSKKHM